ncbi:cyclin-D-binding Myb-like transcription factor 1 isoform X2 [Nematostella vectensis]|nr:cyclin-D-binding Myb-like transcription factor 1 isoform X2 [Nematostella vectensis]
METEKEKKEGTEIDGSLSDEGSRTAEGRAIDLATTPQGLDFSQNFPMSSEDQSVDEIESNSAKRKHPDDGHLEGSDAKAAHLDLQPSDEYEAVSGLVTIATPVAIATSQDTPISDTCSTDLNITNALAAITGQASHEPTLLPSAPAPEVQQDRVNQAWFTTKEDKDTLHGKGMKWRQGMWSKEENDLLNANILEYCKLNNISDPNVIIFSMTKDERKDFYRTIAKGIKRPLFAIYRRVLRMYDRRNYIGKYSNEEVEQLKALKEKHGNDWATIGHAMGRSASSVKDRYRLLRESCQSGKWTADEEERLSNAVHEASGTQPGESVTGGISWSIIAEKVGTRSEKQCRSKWLNYLNWKEKGGKEWTKKDEIKLINKIYDLNAEEENLVNWQTLMSNWPSVRSPQWLRSKWWGLKKHCPVSCDTFREKLDYLRCNWVDTLQSKIERQETRYKGGRITHNFVSSPRQAAYTSGLSSNSIAQTITVNSDGSITREDETVLHPQGRYEVVTVNTIPNTEGGYHTQTSQGQPSYIIHSLPTSLAAGQTYIIQQPTLELMRQGHVEGSLASQGDQVHITPQGVVMTATVLQQNQGVRSLANVSPELAQAIVQTDITGPITASELENPNHLSDNPDTQSLHLSDSGAEQSLESNTLQESLPHQVDISQTHVEEAEMVGATHIIHPAQVAAAVPQMGVVEQMGEQGSQLMEQNDNRHDTYQQGPAAIAQSLDDTVLTVSSGTQQISQHPLSQPILSEAIPQSFKTLVSTFSTIPGEVTHVVQTDVMQSSANEQLHLSSYAPPDTIEAQNDVEVASENSHHMSNIGSVDIACNAEIPHHSLQQATADDDVTPQAVLPEQFLQLHADEHVELPSESHSTLEPSVVVTSM